jgi:hypothetical protein
VRNNDAPAEGPGTPPMSQSPSWQSVVIAVAIIALVGLVFAVGLTQTNDADDFLRIWCGLGTIVGVVAGAISVVLLQGPNRPSERSG